MAESPKYIGLKIEQHGFYSGIEETKNILIPKNSLKEYVQSYIKSDWIGDYQREEEAKEVELFISEIVNYGHSRRQLEIGRGDLEITTTNFDEII